jgi:type III secretion protein V
MSPLRSLEALSILGRRPDLILAAAVAVIVAMLIVPLPIFFLDILLAVNIAAAVTLLMAVLFSRTALELSSFPALLLLTTLFRLGLNISTTRSILSKGDAGEVVTAFGKFVAGGDALVGIVMFLVITLVQFLVIAKGAERVAEVGARFTLDAMPGKQMSIDAALRSGAISEEKAQFDRQQLSRECQLFGNMDGAMKFVKGDAIAGLIITAINAVAGILLGIFRLEMSAAHAFDRYTILTIGDGLVSQIPALAITLAAGVLVTRVDGETRPNDRNTTNLGFDVKREIFARPSAVFAAAALMVVLAVLPGLPAIPFLTIAAFLVLINLAAGLSLAFAANKPKNPASSAAETRPAQRSAETELAPSVPPLGLDLDRELAKELGFDETGRAGPNDELLCVYIPQLRDALYFETGVRFPKVLVRAGSPSLKPRELVVRVSDIPVLKERVDPTRLLAICPLADLLRLGVKDALPAKHPLTGASAALVPLSEKAHLEACGVQVWAPAGVVALHLASVLRKRASTFLGIHEVSELVEKMEKSYPSLVREVLPKVISIAQLTGVLRRLVDEGVSVRDTKTIFEALGEYGDKSASLGYLLEKTRAALSTQLAYAHAGTGGGISAILLDQTIEETIAAQIRLVDGSEELALDPQLSREILEAIKTTLRPLAGTGIRPALLTSTRVRRLVRKLIETDLAPIAVLSFEELPNDLMIHPLATVRVS